MIFSLVIGFVLGVVAIVFALQNTAVVALSFLGWQFQSSLALLVLAALILGMLISALVSIPSAIANSLRTHSLKRENNHLQKEVEKHKQIANDATVRAETAETPVVVQGPTVVAGDIRRI